ncbi:hypothetical protein NIES4071_68240 [Calothrix sp. NIES-4071]|nr:hypothetical protein NIES4071_68240 [Calothrix sp. NIES-4071]BAZ61102.1 hypothetical protein NIES4105_68200 [Calothrix sp. NIES-4105]
MNLHKSEIDALLVQYNIQVNSKRLLWEVDNNKVYGIIVDGINAIETWRQLYEIISVTQHYPVLLGSQEETNCYIENNFTNFAVQDNEALTLNEIINIGNSLNVEQWFTEVEAQRREEWGEFLLEEDEIISYINKIDPVAVEEMVDFDECISPITDYTIIRDFSTKQPYSDSLRNCKNHSYLSLCPTLREILRIMCPLWFVT